LQRAAIEHFIQHLF